MFGPLLVAGVSLSLGFHDCIQHPTLAAHRHSYLEANAAGRMPPPANCSGGLCVGMHNGPHEGGPASYPVGNQEEGFTSIYNTMTVRSRPTTTFTRRSCEEVGSTTHCNLYSSCGG